MKSRFFGTMGYHLFCAPVEYGEALHRNISHLLGGHHINMNIHIDGLFKRIMGLLWILSHPVRRIIWAYFIGRCLTEWRLPSEQIDVTRPGSSPASSFPNRRLALSWPMTSVPQHVWVSHNDYMRLVPTTWKCFQRGYVRRHSRHRWESRPGSRNTPEALLCQTLRVTINLVLV